MIICEMCD